MKIQTNKIQLCIHISLIIAVALIWINPALSADCLQVSAPANFETKGTPAENTSTPGNRGIIPNGFVALKDGTPLVHGIDVSKWQPSANFVEVVNCGGRFAYVRLSAGTNPDNELEYRAHWSNARSVGLLVGPYHNLTLIDPKLGYASLREEEQLILKNRNIAAARKQAKVFLTKLREVLSYDVKSASDDSVFFGLPYLPIALDVSVRPQMNGSISDKQAIGRVYRSAICAWIDEIKKDQMFSEQKILIFTLPSIFKDYDLMSASCDLKTIPIWLSYRPLDGDKPENEPNVEKRKMISNLCEPEGSDNRCIIHQYTSWGGFALFQKDEALDLNRFIGDEFALRKLLQHAYKEVKK